MDGRTADCRNNSVVGYFLIHSTGQRPCRDCTVLWVPMPNTVLTYERRWGSWAWPMANGAGVMGEDLWEFRAHPTPGIWKPTATTGAFVDGGKCQNMGVQSKQINVNAK